MAADAAAAITDECLAQLPPDGRETAYEQWRQRIQERLTRPGFSSSAP
jgi:hypothetical protein